MENIKIDILKAPTGFGKTQYALELAKENKVLLAVPTRLIARQVKERAKEMGIPAIEIEGRNNYVCPYKASLDSVDISSLEKDDYKVNEEFLKYAQDIVCCGRKSCSFDPFGMLKERIQTENPNLVITTHSFLKTTSFADVFDRERVLIIDEIHQFIRGLKDPVESTFISLSNILPYLHEVKKANIPQSAKKQAEETIKYINKKLNTEKKGSFVIWIVRKDGKLIETEHKQEKQEFEEILTSLEKNFELILKAIPRKSKKVDIINLREIGASILSTIRNIKSERKLGSYGFIDFRNSNFPDIKLGIKQVSFSPAMWAVFNGIISNLSPKQIIGMSATIDKKLAKALFSSKRFEIDYKEIPFAFNSTLNLFIFDIAYDYENKAKHLQIIAEKIKQIKTQKPFVILATSYEDIYILSRFLEGDFKVLSQSPDTPVYTLVKEFEETDTDILIGNKSLWEGVNIRKDADFIITKVPFLSPNDSSFKAIEEYSLKDAYPINVKEANITLAQGLGRIIREDGIERNVYVFDIRIRDFAHIINEIPALVKFAILPINVDLKPFQKLEYPVSNDVKKQYYCSFKTMQEKILRGDTIQLGDFANILGDCNSSKLDEEYRKILKANEPEKIRRDKLYGKIYTRIIVDMIELYESLGINESTGYIVKYSNASIDYMRTIKKKLSDIVKRGL
ncbi:MAG: DEAD/DEAH box helicase family protein [Aquificae bacterium]|nr:DEAD/DEAH box helicase family protein [Aquificota bacterium]